MVIFADMQIVPIKIINQSSNELPAYATSGASGMDVRAHLGAPVAFEPLQRVCIPTGLFIELPIGFEAQIRPRSGLALHQGITCLNSPGTIDADYRGEIKIILINLSATIQIINPGDRIAQMVIQTVNRATLIEVLELNHTARNEGSFGHTGKH
ncbi:MAG: hypothetical protein RL115_1667 [Bacteroidota bacterium]